ncbi:MAG: hypothetical protein ACR2NF_01080 [Pirellulales bacterium]
MPDFLHKWLGIPPDEQPPNHYRLLGLRVFEDDADVIDAAADKHLAFLHNLANGEHGKAAEDLSNEISAARILLLNSVRKAKYDSVLRPEIARSHVEDSAENAYGFGTKSPAQAIPPLPLASARTPESLPNMEENYVVDNKTIDVPSTLIAAPEPVAVYDQRKPRKASSKVGMKQRRRRVSWIDHFFRLSSVFVCLAITYVAYGLLTGELVLDRDAASRLFSGTGKTPPITDAPQRSIRKRSSVRGGVGNAKRKQEQPSRRYEFERDRGPSPEDSAPGQMPRPKSEEVSPNPTIPSDESIEQQISEILEQLEGDSYYNKMENDHPEEVAHYFYNQAVKLADEGKDKEGLAYFTLAYRKLLMLKRYKACLSVLDSIPGHYAAYHSQERKLDLIQKQLKLDLGRDRSLFLACCELIEECVRNGEFVDANRLCDSLHVSNLVEDTPSEELFALRRSITEFQEAFDNKESGENRPPSPESSESIGIFYCFYADDWEKGLKHLSESGGEYSEPADLERKSVPPLKVAEAWEKVWKEEELPIRKQAIGRRMLTNYNKYRLQDPGSVQTTLGKKLDRFVKQVFPRTANEFVWGRNAFPRVMDTTAKAVEGKKPDVSKGNQFERSRRLTFMVAAGDTGEQFAAIELDNVSQINVDVKQKVQLQTQEMTRGLIVDYHTPGGYFSRVFIRFDQNRSSSDNVVSAMPWSEVPIGAARVNRLPAKSCGARPVDKRDRRDERDLRIDLEEWSPPDWDGRVWFMVYLKDAMPGYVLSCTAKW